MLKRSIRQLVTTLVFLASSVFAVSAFAQSALPAPKGDIILKINGNITNTNVDGEAHFDINMIHDMPTSIITTNSPWYEGPVDFKGVSLQYVLELVGADGNDMDSSAADGYKVLIPMQDATDYPMIIAYEVYGEALIAGRRGPLWIMYPFDEYPDTQDTEYEERAIWELMEITIH